MQPAKNSLKKAHKLQSPLRSSHFSPVGHQKTSRDVGGGATARLHSEARDALRRLEERITKYSKSLRSDIFRVLCWGSARLGPESQAFTSAVGFGRALGSKNFDVITGGGPALMRAFNTGAREGYRIADAVGQSIGVTLNLPTETANEACQAIAAQDFLLRLRIMGTLGTAFVGDKGGVGTALEMAYALRFNEASRDLNPERDLGIYHYNSHKHLTSLDGYLPKVYALDEWEHVFSKFIAMGRQEGILSEKDVLAAGLRFAPDHDSLLEELIHERREWQGHLKKRKEQPESNEVCLKDKLEFIRKANERYNVAMTSYARDLPLYYRIAVLGSSSFERASTRYAEAENLAVNLTSANIDVVTSGSGGISEAVIVGARRTQQISTARAISVHHNHPHTVIGKERSHKEFSAHHVAHEADLLGALASGYVVFPGGFSTLLQTLYPLQLNQMTAANIRNNRPWQPELALRNTATQKAHHLPKIWVIGGWKQFFEALETYGDKHKTIRKGELEESGIRFVEDINDLPLAILNDRLEWRKALQKNSLTPLS